MITARQAITSQYYSAQLWSVPPTDQQQTLVVDNTTKLLDQKISATDPTVIWCNLEATTIGIDQVRQLQAQLSFSSGKKRFVFLLCADLLTTQAQHALLKLLEEPPSNTQLVLVSNKPQAILTTIRSRCSEQRLHSDDKIMESDSADSYLQWKQLGISNAIEAAAAYKKQDAAIPILESVVRYLRNHSLPATIDSKTEQEELLLDIDYCLQALEKLDRNVNAQLVMEQLFFRLNKHTS